MLVHLDCDELVIKLSGGGMEVDCKLGRKKCLGCRKYISYINIPKTHGEYKGLLEQLIKK